MHFFRLVDLGINSMRLYTYQANPRYNWFSGLAWIIKSNGFFTFFLAIAQMSDYNVMINYEIHIIPSCK